MPATYTLDTKIAALNLLARLDDDFHQVKARLKIPLETLKNWRSGETQLRHKYEDRQYRHIASINLEILVDTVETARDIIRIIKSGDHQGMTISQLAYTFSTLLNQAHRLEGNFSELEQDTQNDPDPPNRIEYIYEGGLHDVPPWEFAHPEARDPLQSMGLRAALEQFGIGAQADPESRPPAAPSHLMDRPYLTDDQPNQAPLPQQAQTPNKRNKKSKRKAH